MKKTKILIVEDETIISMELKMRLESKGYQFVFTTISGEQAVKMAASLQPDVILMDIMLNGKLNGIEAAERILSRRKIAIIYITANSNLKYDPQLIGTRPVAVLAKPVEERELFGLIEKTVN